MKAPPRSRKVAWRTYAGYVHATLCPRVTQANIRCIFHIYINLIKTCRPVA